MVGLLIHGFRSTDLRRQWRHLKQSCRPDLKISHWERIPKNEGSKNVEIRAQNVEGEAMKIDLVATETGVADTATEKGT